MMRNLCLTVLVLIAIASNAIAQSPMDKKVSEAIKLLHCDAPTEEQPLTMKAGTLVFQDSLAVMVKVQLAPGWHIYQYVPPTMPYLQFEPILKLSDGMEASKNWQMPDAVMSRDDPGVMIYENEAWFVNKLSLKGASLKDVTLETGLYYQICNARQCLQPVEKTEKLKL